MIKSLIVCLVLAVIIVILVVVPLTFSYVAINNIAFRKNSISNDVDRSQVYPNGRYAWGPSFAPVLFPSTFKRIVVQGISVFTDGGLTVSFDCVFYYRLNPAQLPQLYSNFGLSYEARILSTASAAIRNGAAGLNIDQLLDDRVAVTSNIYQLVQSELSTKAYVTVPSTHFMIQSVVLPTSVLNQKVAIFNVAQEQIVANNTATATLVRLQTSQRVTALDNQAQLIAVNATVVSERLVFDAQNGATTAIETAKSQLMGDAMTALGINTSSAKEQFVLANRILDANSSLQVTLVRGLTSAIINP